jgi:hypothetical protein
MENTLKSVKRELSGNQYVQSIFDPVQTHAIYGISSSQEVSELKIKIKNSGLGNRFRQIKNRFGNYILCFKLINKK